ncbi:hypothetical protein [Tessaracoccus lapidicaptus]|nr:hypothetical protein [Tessaracoccus lapidicaptus]
MIAQLTAAAGGLFVNLLSTQGLAPDARGEMALFIQAAYVVQSLAMLGRDRSYLVGGPLASNASIPRSFLSSNRAALVLLMLAGMALLTLSHTADGRWYRLAALSLFFACTGIFGYALRTAYILGSRGAGRIYGLSTVSLQAVIVTSAAVLFTLGVNDITAWIALYPASGLVNVFATIFMIKASSPTHISSLPLRRSLAREGWRLLPLNVMTVFLQKADRLLLPLLATAAELGRYAFVSSIMELVVWPVSQWLDTQLRRWRDVSGSLSRRSVSRLLLRVLLAATAFASATGVLALLYITLVLPSDYAPARLLILPLGLYGVLKVLSRVFVAVQVARMRSAAATAIELSGLLASVALFFVLTPTHGAIGTALSMVAGGAASLGVASLLSLNFRQKKAG